MNVYVETTSGSFSIDLEDEKLEPWDGTIAEDVRPAVNLPRLISAASVGSTIVALVDAKPPLLISYDMGSTWRESGRGLPAGVAIAVADADPDVIVLASRNRLFLSRNGGVFWSSLAAELPTIVRIAVE